MVEKILKVIKKYFPGKYGILRYSENYNPEIPETKKFEIGVIENLILIEKIYIYNNYFIIIFMFSA